MTLEACIVKFMHRSHALGAYLFAAKRCSPPPPTPQSSCNDHLCSSAPFRVFIVTHPTLKVYVPGIMLPIVDLLKLNAQFRPLVDWTQLFNKQVFGIILSTSVVMAHGLYVCMYI